MADTSQSGYLSPGDHITRRLSSNIINLSDRKQVVVVNVVDPMVIFVKLKDEFDTYYILKQSLAIFYGPGGQGFRHHLPPYFLCPNLYTVVNYNGMWIRFYILTVHFAANAVLGISVDFGHVITLEISEFAFYPLHRLFASLPPQAIHCQLFNVLPSKKKGNALKSVELLTNMTGSDRKLSALFVAEDKVPESYEIILVDETSEEPFFTVEKLMDAGYLKFKHKAKRSKPKK